MSHKNLSYLINYIATKHASRVPWAHNRVAIIKAALREFARALKRKPA